MRTREADGASGVQSLAETAVHAGGAVVVPPGRQPWGYVALVADTDGHLWQLHAHPDE